MERGRQNEIDNAIENSLALTLPPVPSFLTPSLPFLTLLQAQHSAMVWGQNDNLRGLSRSGSDKERLGKYNHAATTPTTPGEKKRKKVAIIYIAGRKIKVRRSSFTYT